MTARPAGIRRLCLAVRSGGDARHLAGLLDRLCGALPLDRILWNTPTGPTMLGVFPPGIDEPQVVADLFQEAARAAADLGLHLRLALHEGLVTMAGGEFTGTAMNVVHRLCALRELAAASGPGPVAVALSGRIFDDLTAFGGVVPVARFRRTAVDACPVWYGFLGGD